MFNSFWLGDDFEIRKDMTFRSWNCMNVRLSRVLPHVNAWMFGAEEMFLTRLIQKPSFIPTFLCVHPSLETASFLNKRYYFGIRKLMANEAVGE